MIPIRGLAWAVLLASCGAWTAAQAAGMPPEQAQVTAQPEGAPASTGGAEDAAPGASGVAQHAGAALATAPAQRAGSHAGPHMQH